MPHKRLFGRKSYKNNLLEVEVVDKLAFYSRKLEKSVFFLMKTDQL